MWEQIKLHEQNDRLKSKARESLIRELSDWEGGLSCEDRGVSFSLSCAGPFKRPSDLLLPMGDAAKWQDEVYEVLDNC